MKKNVIPLRTGKAPSPRKGVAKRVYECLDEMGDWTGESVIVQFTGTVKHSENMSRPTAIKQALAYLIREGHAVWQQAGRGKEYKIAPLNHYELYQGREGLPFIKQKKKRIQLPPPNTLTAKLINVVLVAFAVLCLAGAYRAVFGI